MRRAALTLVTILGFALAGASTVGAAGELIGGTLSVSPKEVILTSTSTIPVGVTMTTEGPFSVIPAAFDMAPGASQAMTVTGDARGRVSATLHVLSVQSGDTASVTLTAGMPDARAPFNPLPIGLALLILCAAGLTLLRLRPWQYTITRKGS